MAVQDNAAVNRKYSDKYDAFYAADTGEWLESQCSDASCRYCGDRPVLAELDGDES